MGTLETNTTLIYGVHVRESANDGSDFTNAAADYRILFLGEDGLLHVKDSSGTVTNPFSGGSGATHAKVGTTSLGASFDTTMKAVYKKITLANDCLIASISVGIKGQSSGTAMIDAGVMSDNSGTPLNVIGAGYPTRSAAGSSNDLRGSFVINATARFVTMPCGLWVTAGDYWLVAVNNANSGSDVQLAYSSGTGSDRTKATTDGLYDHSVGASSTGSNDYSVHCDTIR
jgi:hypothetical protein